MHMRTHSASSASSHCVYGQNGMLQAVCIFVLSCFARRCVSSWLLVSLSEESIRREHLGTVSQCLDSFNEQFPMCAYQLILCSIVILLFVCVYMGTCYVAVLLYLATEFRSFVWIAFVPRPTLMSWSGNEANANNAFIGLHQGKPSFCIHAFTALHSGRARPI